MESAERTVARPPALASFVRSSTRHPRASSRPAIPIGAIHSWKAVRRDPQVALRSEGLGSALGLRARLPRHTGWAPQAERGARIAPALHRAASSAPGPTRRRSLLTLA